MAIKLPDGTVLRNLQEQVLKNKQDIEQHYNQTRTLELFDVKVIGVLDEWVEPEGQTFEYGDAYFVGTEAPYSLYIFTRADSVHPNDYWLEIKDLIVQGPAGKPLTFDELTEAQKEQLRGEPGINPKWFVVDRVMGVSGPKEGDMLLQGSSGDVYQYEGGNFVLKTNIKGKDGRGIYWVRINANGELLVEYDNGTQTNLGKVVGSPGRDGADGKIITTITNIIAVLTEYNPNLGNVYDPSTLQPNDAVVMPTPDDEGDYSDHIWIIVNGHWEDGGPFTGGSSVYAGGVFQQYFNADHKLDAKGAADLPETGRGAVYGLTLNGTQKLYKISTAGSFAQSKDKEAIPVYDLSGFLYARQPTQSETSLTKVATVGYVKSAIQNAHSNTETFHLGVFGAKTDDINSLPLYNIPVAPFGNSSNIQVKCDVMFHTGNDYLNVPVPTYLQLSMISPPDPDGNAQYYWTIYESMTNTAMASGYCGAVATDQALENAYFQIGDDQYYNEAYITIHCTHDSTYFFPPT